MTTATSESELAASPSRTLTELPPPPRFSVVVPALNEGAYIAHCLESLRAQNFDGPIEVVVVDNGSNDDTAQVALACGATVVTEPRRGVCWARQAGTEVARGEIVVSTDADTEFDPGWLSRIDERFRAQPDVVAVVGPCQFVDAPWWGRIYTTVLFGVVGLVYRLTGRVVYATATNIAFRRSLWTGYDAHLTQGGDELGLLRRLRGSGRIEFDRENRTFTSSRRLRRGLLYNALVTCLYYYVFAYCLNRLVGRRVVGSAPEFREVDQAAVASREIQAARRSVRMALGATAVTHALLLRRALGPDEGGFLVVARHWGEVGPYLYGPTWVDRPPGLIALFALADHLGPWGVRVTMVALSVTLVALAASAARLVGGSAAAPWAAWTAYALGSSVLLQAEQLNGEYAAATCVAASMLLVLLAIRWRTNHVWLLGIVAGVAATAAVTMKQNFLDAFVFGVVLLGGTALVDRAARRVVTRVVAGYAVGLGIVVTACLAWTSAHGGPGALLFAMYGFRARATEVQMGSLAAPDHRMWDLLALCLGSGLLVLAVHLICQGRGVVRSRNPLAWALTATAGFELMSLVAGANFWPHYALAFIPVVALTAGLAARQGRPGWVGTQRIIAAMAVLTAVISPVAALANGPGEAWTIGHWVHQSSAPGDSIVVPYTHPNIVAASELRPGYPYMWSLPIRTLDPRLARLTSVLESRRGPTWVVIWDHPQTWKLDRHGQLQQSLRGHYRMVGHVCRHPVWLRSDVTRALAPRPRNCGGGAL